MQHTNIIHDCVSNSILTMALVNPSGLCAFVAKNSAPLIPAKAGNQAMSAGFPLS
jgi:hypothetical protein